MASRRVTELESTLTRKLEALWLLLSEKKVRTNSNPSQQYNHSLVVEPCRLASRVTWSCDRSEVLDTSTFALSSGELVSRISGVSLKAFICRFVAGNNE